MIISSFDDVVLEAHLWKWFTSFGDFDEVDFLVFDSMNLQAKLALYKELNPDVYYI